MGTTFKWSEQDKQKLVECTTPEEMLANFPNKKLANLMRRQTEFKSERNGNGNRKENHDFDPDPDFVVPQLPETTEDLVPRTLLTKALRERDAAKSKNLEMIRAINKSVLEASEYYVIKPLTSYVRPVQNVGTEEIAILDIADWQAGKATPTYNIDVCAQRVKSLGEKVKKIINIQRADHPVNELHLRALGDLVEGEGIYPIQSHQIDSSLYRQIFDTITILSTLILDILDVVERVHFVGVVGNHGQVRLAKGASDPETNMDRLVYKAVQQVLMGPERMPNTEIRNRVTWDIPEGKGNSHWYAIDRIFDWGHLLCHGDQIKGGFAGFPFYGTAKKAWGWIDSVDEPWDELHFGHWHTPTMQTLNNRRAICCGSIESDNLYAQEQLGAVGYPSQLLAFVHPKYHVTSQYWIDLSEDGRIPSMRKALYWGQK